MRGAVLAGALVAVMASPALASAECPDADLIATPDNLGPVADAIVCLIDDWRTSANRVALTRSSELDLSSRRHSQDMVARHYLAHEREHGPTVLDRIRASGYFDGAKDGLYSENIGVVPRETASAGNLVNAWLASPEHRDNLSHPGFRNIGVGFAFAPPDPAFYPDYASLVVTTDFGQRSLRPARRRHASRCRARRYRRAHPYCAHRPR